LELNGFNLRIRGFKDEIDVNAAYVEVEKQLLNQYGSDVVLVGAKSFHYLKIV